MNKVTIGISPGTRIIGYAVFINGDLTDYGVKTIKGKWSKEKLALIKNTIKRLCQRYYVTHIVLKIPLSYLSSKKPEMVSSGIISLAHNMQIGITKYNRKEIGELIGIKGGYRKPIMEWVISSYPELKKEYEIEIKDFRRPYYRKMFEAILIAKGKV